MRFYCNQCGWSSDEKSCPTHFKEEKVLPPLPSPSSESWSETFEGKIKVGQPRAYDSFPYFIPREEWLAVKEVIAEIVSTFKVRTPEEALEAEKKQKELEEKAAKGEAIENKTNDTE